MVSSISFIGKGVCNMSPMLLFLYNLFLIIAYTSVIASLSDQFIEKKESYLIPIIVLYVFYLIDTIIIYLTNEFAGFATWYDVTFMSVPTVKTIIYLGTAFCLLQIWNKFVNGFFPPYQGIILILMGLWYLFIPMMENSPVKVWLYYIAYQIFTLSFSLLGLKKIGRESLSEPVKKILKTLLILTAVFSVFIAAEDSFVIFTVDIYSQNRIYIQDRNYCEDILRICYTAIILYTIYRSKLKITDDFSLGTAETEDNLNKPQAESASPLSPKTITDEEKKYIYAQSIHLTDREGEIFSLLIDDKNNQQISESLYISIGTVKTHIHNIFQKAGVAHRDELIQNYKRFFDNNNIY